MPAVRDNTALSRFELDAGGVIVGDVEVPGLALLEVRDAPRMLLAEVPQRRRIA